MLNLDDRDNSHSIRLSILNIEYIYLSSIIEKYEICCNSSSNSFSFDWLDDV
jgi:hypothetical protein